MYPIQTINDNYIHKKHPKSINHENINTAILIRTQLSQHANRKRALPIRRYIGQQRNISFLALYILWR